MHRPQVLFLDEPSTGLDPQNRANLWEQFRLLRDGGTTVFLTTHYLEEADQLCDRVAIVDHGKVIALGSPDELKQRYSADTIAVAAEAPPLVLDAVCPRTGGCSVHHDLDRRIRSRRSRGDPADRHRRYPGDGGGLRRAGVAGHPHAGRLGRAADA